MMSPFGPHSNFQRMISPTLVLKSVAGEETVAYLREHMELPDSLAKIFEKLIDKTDFVDKRKQKTRPTVKFNQVRGVDKNEDLVKT